MADRSSSRAQPLELAKAAPQTFDTAAVPARERAAYWREAICESYVNLACECADEGFGGRIDLRRPAAYRAVA